MSIRLPLAGVTDLAARLDTAREQQSATMHLERAIDSLEAALNEPMDPALVRIDEAFASLDAYLEELLSLSGQKPSCGARCASCCHDAPVASPIESLRVARALASREDAGERFAIASAHAEELRSLLMQAILERGTGGLGQDAYRAAHLAFRAKDLRCAALDDEGMCVAYDVRPLACRTFSSLDDPDDCRVGSPRFETARRPPMWTGEKERRVVDLLVAIGRKHSLPHAPNLPWGLAALQDHSATRSPPRQDRPVDTPKTGW